MLAAPCLELLGHVAALPYLILLILLQGVPVVWQGVTLEEL